MLKIVVKFSFIFAFFWESPIYKLSSCSANYLVLITISQQSRPISRDDFFWTSKGNRKSDKNKTRPQSHLKPCTLERIYYQTTTHSNTWSSWKSWAVSLQKMQKFILKIYHNLGRILNRRFLWFSFDGKNSRVIKLRHSLQC